MSVAPWITDEAVSLPTAKRRTNKNKGSVSTTSGVSLFKTAVKHAFWFVILSFISFGLTTLMGHSLKTSASNVRASAETRADGARADVFALSSQLAELTSIERLDRWADAHGFSRPGSVSGAGHGRSVKE